MIAARDGVYPGDAEEEDEPEPEGEEKETTCSTLQAGTRAPTGSRAVPTSSTTQAAVFALVRIAWANGSLHHELHGHHDARARTRFLLQILVLAAMGTFIPQADAARGAAFAVAAAVLFAVLAVLWLLAARGDRPEYHRPRRLLVAGTAACFATIRVSPIRAWCVLVIAAPTG